ncbi:MAG TPA: hypothetical protein VGO14_02990 [Solirubrobacteraceae bacterium]|jgi:hypothetical protein|nr:hypothetical protein [Solirubrobacteraceae bacterium]
MTPLLKPAVRMLCAVGLAVGLAACGTTVSTASFKGEQREVAQAISNLQTDVKAADQQKVCANDLAGPVVARLNAAPGGCKQVLKGQLTEIDNADATVESVQITKSTGKRTATAHVKSTYNGKKVLKTVSLVYEGGKWRVLSVA